MILPSFGFVYEHDVYSIRTNKKASQTQNLYYVFHLNMIKCMMICIIGTGSKARIGQGKRCKT